MAEKHNTEAGQDGCGSVVADNQNEINSEKHSGKRCSSTSPISAPPPKSPRSDMDCPTTQSPEGQTERQEMTENMEEAKEASVSPSARRKSWRRATITRRSLPSLPNPYQALCRSISTSLSQQERLDKLMEASRELAIERTQSTLQSVPNASLESFQKRVESIQKEWGCLAKSIRSKPDELSTKASSEPAVLKAIEKCHQAINRLQAENESWDALLNKHHRKAEELERKVEQSQENSVPLDSALVAQSSQYPLIQNKPDYHALLCRQQPLLHTMTMIMDTQYKMVRELQSIKVHSQLLVKETSSQLAADAGFQDDHLRNLTSAYLTKATT
ncbi:kinetochore-associated protein DSN1 homolog isoform 2-T2 [Pholidichthys leucotaenia]